MRHLFFYLALTVATPLAAEQRNVLLLISDNQNQNDLGCYGHPVVKTPNLDRLAAEGIRFDHAFATTASCGPSRAVMYTGLLTHRNGQYAHPHAEHNQQLREDVTTVFAMLKGAGYRTGLIGKDHIKPMEKYPIDHHPRIPSREVDTMAEAAAEFFEAGEDSFFLVVSYHDPHPISREGVAWGVSDDPTENGGYEKAGYRPEDVVVPPFLPDTLHVREGIAGYYEQIGRMDHGVGLVLDELEKSGHRDDTLVIFYSDHGTSEPGAMGTHYEPGVRVPFLVRQPGLEGKVSPNSAMLTFADITPTILDWTETEFSDYPLHGRSILPLLSDPKAFEREEVLLSHVGHDVFAYYPMRTLRGRRWKLIWNLVPGTEYPLPIDTVQRRTWTELRARGDERIGGRLVSDFLQRPRLELYDLESDPWETTNLAAHPHHAERIDAMAARMMKLLEEQGDPWIRKFRPDGKEQ